MWFDLYTELLKLKYVVSDEVVMKLLLYGLISLILEQIQFVRKCTSKPVSKIYIFNPYFLRRGSSLINQQLWISNKIYVATRVDLIYKCSLKFQDLWAFS